VLASLLRWRSRRQRATVTMLVSGWCLRSLDDVFPGSSTPPLTLQVSTFLSPVSVLYVDFGTDLIISALLRVRTKMQMPRGSCQLSLQRTGGDHEDAPRITWLSTIQHDLRSHNLTLPEAMDIAKHRSLWRMWSTYNPTPPGRRSAVG